MKIVLHAIAKKKTKGFKGFKFGTVIGRFQCDLMAVKWLNRNNEAAKDSEPNL